MPAKPSRVMYHVTKLMKFHLFREFVVRTSGAPQGMKYRDSVPSDVKDDRVALVSGTKGASLFVTDLDRAQKFYEDCVGLKHLKTGEPVPHPYESDRTVTVRAMGFGETPDLLLVQQRDAAGNVLPVATNGLHHVCFWIEQSTHINDFAKELKRKGFELSYGPVKHYSGPGGDGGWGGNRAVYLNDPDGHFIEYSNEMDPYGTRYELRGH